jgi:Caspase domain
LSALCWRCDTKVFLQDGFDEALVPLDFKDVGMILDDDLFENIIQKLPKGVHLVCLMDCCHSGSILDLPYIFTADGSQSEMQPNSKFDIDTWCTKMGADLGAKLCARLGRRFLGDTGAAMGSKMGAKLGEAIGDKLGDALGGRMKKMFG